MIFISNYSCRYPEFRLTSSNWIFVFERYKSIICLIFVYQVRRCVLRGSSAVLNLSWENIKTKDKFLSKELEIFSKVPATFTRVSASFQMIYRVPAVWASERYFNINKFICNESLMRFFTNGLNLLNFGISPHFLGDLINARRANKTNNKEIFNPGAVSNWD